MRRLPHLQLVAAWLLLAVATPALAGEPAPRVRPLRDFRELKLYRREVTEDRQNLARLRTRLERLDALRAARTLDTRALGELDAKVHGEMLREAREAKLRAKPTLGEAYRNSGNRPLAGPPGSASPGPPRFFTAADASRVDQITVEWGRLRGRTGEAEVRERRTLLAELVELCRVELEDDRRAYREAGGDPADIPEDEEAEPDEPPPARR